MIICMIINCWFVIKPLSMMLQQQGTITIGRSQVGGCVHGSLASTTGTYPYPKGWWVPCSPFHHKFGFLPSASSRLWATWAFHFHPSPWQLHLPLPKVFMQCTGDRNWIAIAAALCCCLLPWMWGEWMALCPLRFSEFSNGQWLTVVNKWLITVSNAS